MTFDLVANDTNHLAVVKFVCRTIRYTVSNGVGSWTIINKFNGRQSIGAASSQGRLVNMAAARVAPTLKLPDIQTKGIYEGKYIERNPDISTAGKLTASGDSANGCMKPDKRPDSPEVVRRFRATLRPDAGRARIFYGRAKDPQLTWAASMVHGLQTYPSFMAGQLLNPQPNSRFKQAYQDKLDSTYASNQRAPLGKSHNQMAGLPNGLNPAAFMFGIETEHDGSAGELINPNKDRNQVNEEYEQGKDLYRRTHFNYHVGEKCDRKYPTNHFNKTNKFGIPTPHENDGKLVRKTLQWLHDARCEKTTPIVAKRVDDFRERTQPQLGQVHDPIKDTLTVPPDHTFGILIKPDAYGAGDLLHGRVPGEYLRGKDRMRGVIAAMRQHLKKSNYHNFHDLLSAFQYYDKNGSGKIDILELRDACLQFSLPVEPELLEQLMDFCDKDRDGQISYLEFANFLNWKDKMHSGLPPAGVPLPENDIINSADLKPKSAQQQESTPQHLQAQIDLAIGQHRTSANMINAVIGGVSIQDYRTYGVPTIRTDLPAPRIRRIDDHKNYGDESNAYGLMNPSVYSNRGVHEQDFLMPREKEELFEIFKSIGVLMTLDSFDSIYALASQRHPKGHVSVESFRNILDEVQAVDMQQKGLA